MIMMMSVQGGPAIFDIGNASFLTTFSLRALAMPMRSFVHDEGVVGMEIFIMLGFHNHIRGSNLLNSAFSMFARRSELSIFEGKMSVPI